MSLKDRTYIRYFNIYSLPPPVDIIRAHKKLKANVKKRTQQYEKMTNKNNSVHNKIPLKMEVLPGWKA